jgi:tungstate transport system ATP-binding protein
VAKTLLTVDDVTVRYGALTTLHIPFLSVEAGEVLSLIGPNGAGKSTLIRIMALLQPPSAGAVHFEGSQDSWKDRFDIRRRVATVFQDPLLLKGTVHDNVAVGLKMRGLDKTAIKDRVQPWLARLNIEHLARQQTQNISGGEAQRTSLARAFVLNPELLLLDEPFSPLDPIGRERILEDLAQILKETGTTTVLVTHHRDEAFMLADRVGVLNEGRLLQTGPARDVFNHPLTERVAEIVGVENRIAGVAKESAGSETTVGIESTRVQVGGCYPPGSRLILCIRAEDVHVSESDVPIARNGLNRLSGKIVSISSRIRGDQLTVQIGSGLLYASVPAHKSQELGLCAGKHVVLTFSAKTAHVISPGRTDTV